MKRTFLLIFIFFISLNLASADLKIYDYPKLEDIPNDNIESGTNMTNIIDFSFASGNRFCYALDWFLYSSESYTWALADVRRSASNDQWQDGWWNLEYYKQITCSVVAEEEEEKHIFQKEFFLQIISFEIWVILFLIIFKFFKIFMIWKRKF